MQSSNGVEEAFRTLGVRPATSADEPFLLKLFATTRADELALTNWDENQKQAFIGMQFAAQSRHYVSHYPHAEHKIILLNDEPIGRLLVDRGDLELTLIDIALLPAYRGTGIGTRLIQEIVTEAVASSKPIRLQVLTSNPAKRVYERLGFSLIGGNAAYQEMLWIPPVSPSLIPYRISPYVSFIENRLFPGIIQHGVSHRLTGEVFEPNERILSLLLAMQTGNRISLSKENLNNLSDDGRQLTTLIEREFLIPDDYDPLTRFLNHYVARPIQNPALVYHSQDGTAWLVRTSMAHHLFSPKPGELPEIVEEAISDMAAAIFTMADGSKTLLEISAELGRNQEKILKDVEFREVLDLLTDQERQLIKFTEQRDDLDHPFKPVNIVPRDLYHSSKWNSETPDDASESISAFHLDGIEDAQWEFDLIEPTVNHSFRFPNPALGGFDYGSRFAMSTFRPEVLPLLTQSNRLEILEVGGGTGTFARSFIDQSQRLAEEADRGIDLNYYILDLSPTLMQSQRKLLSQLVPTSSYFHQDATKFSLPGRSFDLIIANEVIADFPMAVVQRRFSNEGKIADNTRMWQGSGVHYLEKYGLNTDNAPDSFWVSAGAFDFIERCYEHLSPGGALLVSEYGSPQQYPIQAYHLNHEEFSVHFGHLKACAESVGFECRLLTLKEFLALDDRVLVLNGREEHFLILNHVLKKQGMSLPYAVISKSEFEERFQTIVERIGLQGFSFSPISSGYHFGPKIDDFMLLIMTKPLE
jgi:SAM-dependent MidA family methyltransferase/ribosomal protein S18 acetylase RimI-like enzyme